MARTKQTCRKANLTPEELQRLESEVEIVHGPNARRKPQSKTEKKIKKRSRRPSQAPGSGTKKKRKRPRVRMLHLLDFICDPLIYITSYARFAVFTVFLREKVGQTYFLGFLSLPKRTFRVSFPPVFVLFLHRKTHFSMLFRCRCRLASKRFPRLLVLAKFLLLLLKLLKLLKLTGFRDPQHQPSPRLCHSQVALRLRLVQGLQLFRRRLSISPSRRISRRCSTSMLMATSPMDTNHMATRGMQCTGLLLLLASVSHRHPANNHLLPLHKRCPHRLMTLQRSPRLLRRRREWSTTTVRLSLTSRS